MSMQKIKRNDQVKIMTGKFRNHVGAVIAVDDDYVKVSGANRVKAVKANPQKNVEGGLKPVPAKIHRSNVALVDPTSQKVIKVGIKEVDGKKVRFDKATGEIIEDKV